MIVTLCFCDWFSNFVIWIVWCCFRLLGGLAFIALGLVVVDCLFVYSVSFCCGWLRYYLVLICCLGFILGFVAGWSLGLV